MSKSRSSQTKKVSISQLNNHAIHNKRQALKDLMKLNLMIYNLRIRHKKDSIILYLKKM